MPNLNDTERELRRRANSSLRPDEKFTFFCLQMKMMTGKGPPLFLIGPKLTIGREKCDVNLAHASVSHRHAVLKEKEGVLLLEDLNSAEGTFVNGRRIGAGRTLILEKGDRLAFGKFEATVLLKNEDDLKRLHFAERAVFSATTPAPSANAKAPATVAAASKDKLDLSEITPPPLPAEVFAEIRRPTPPEVKPAETVAAAAAPAATPVQLKVKDKVKVKVIDKEKKKAPLGATWRVAALALDGLLNTFVMTNIYTHPLYLQLEKGSVPVVGSALELTWGRETIFHALSFLVVMGLVQFFSCLLVGASLGQSCLGIRGGESFLWNRLGGAIRSLVGVVTTPLLVFDLPCLFGRRTVKEWMTLTSLEWKGFWAGARALFLLVPPFLLLAIFWPALSLKAEKTNLTVINVKANGPSALAAKGAVGRPSLLSNHFQFSIRKAPDFGQSILLAPSFDIIRGGKARKIRPVLEFVDPKRKVKGFLRAKRYFPMLTFLREVKRRDGWFAQGYPTLNKIIEGTHEGETPNLPAPALSAQGKRELLQLFKDSFTMPSWTSKKWMKFAWQKGPTPYGHQYLQDGLLRLLEGREHLRAEFIRLGNQEFLSLYSNGIVPFHQGDMVQKILVPLETLNGLMMELRWESWSRSNRPLDAIQSMEKDLVAQFFDQLEWHWKEGADKGQRVRSLVDDLNPFPALGPSGREEFLTKLTLFHVVDYFALKRLDKAQRAPLEDFIYHYFFDLGRKMVSARKLPLADQENGSQIWPLDVIKKLQDVTTLLHEGEEEASENPFVQNMQQLQEAIKGGDYKFFEIAPPAKAPST